MMYIKILIILTIAFILFLLNMYCKPKWFETKRSNFKDLIGFDTKIKKYQTLVKREKTKKNIKKVINAIKQMNEKYLKKEKNKNVLLEPILNLLLFIGIYFALVLILPASSFEILVHIFFAYLLIVLLVKMIIGAIVTRKESASLFHYKSVFNLYGALYHLFYLFISPDYYLTYLVKEKIDGIEKKNNGEIAKQLRSAYIRANNIFNIIFTCILAFFSYIWIQCGFGNVEILYYILFVRIVSRTIEIILSFILDVISFKKKKSNLRFSRRCSLAITSLFEVLMLAFIVFYVGYHCKMVGGLTMVDDVSFTLSSILANFFKMEELKPSLQFLKYMIDLTCFSLLGIVITSYIGEKKS